MTTKKNPNSEIRSFLMSSALLSEPDACVITPLPARTAVARVDRAGGPPLFVKKLISSQSMGDKWLDSNAERANSIASGVRPRTIHNQDGWYVSDYCGNATTFKTMPDAILTETLAENLGMALSRFHSTDFVSKASGEAAVEGRSGADPQRRVRCMPPLTLQEYTEMPGLDRDIFVKSSQHCSNGIRRLSNKLKRACAVHGDLQGNNILVGSGVQGSLYIVDWENAGMGDPTWDLGHFFASLLQRWIRSAGNAPDSLVDFLEAERSSWTVLSGWFAGFAECYWASMDQSVRDLVSASKTLSVAGHAILERSANILHVYGRFTAKDILLLSIAERLVTNPGHAAAVLVPGFRSWNVS